MFHLSAGRARNSSNNQLLESVAIYQENSLQIQSDARHNVTSPALHAIKNDSSTAPFDLFCLWFGYDFSLCTSLSQIAAKSLCYYKWKCPEKNLIMPNREYQCPLNSPNINADFTFILWDPPRQKWQFTVVCNSCWLFSQQSGKLLILRNSFVICILDLSVYPWLNLTCPISWFENCQILKYVLNTMQHLLKDQWQKMSGGATPASRTKRIKVPSFSPVPWGGSCLLHH